MEYVEILCNIVKCVLLRFGQPNECHKLYLNMYNKIINMFKCELINKFVMERDTNNVRLIRCVNKLSNPCWSFPYILDLTTGTFEINVVSSKCDI